MASTGKDELVQGTNDCSILSKCSMVNAGYIEDPHIRNFADKHWSKRSSLINRCYHVRVKAIRRVLHEWVESKLEGKQIISLGAGFDTSYFHLREKYPDAKLKYVEIDYPHLIRRKMLLSRKPDLFGPRDLGYDLSKLDAPMEEPLVEDGGKYTAIGLDLRNVGDKLQQMLTSNGICLNKPTLFISEVSVVYMKPVYSDYLFRWLSSKFTNMLVCQLEQIRPHDEFGLVMMEHFEKLACPIETVYSYPTVQSQIRRFVEKFQHKHTVGCDLLQFYNKNYTNEEKIAVENREKFDEYEGWHRTLQHYSLVLTANGNCDVISSICDVIIGSQYNDETCGELEEDEPGIKIKLLEKFDGKMQMYGHCSVVSSIDPDKIYVYGGFGIPFSSNPQKKSPHKRIQQLTVIDAKNFNCDVTPSPFKHVMNSQIVSFVTSRGEEKLMVWGGRASPGNCSSDVIAFEGGEWVVMTTEGSKPRGRHRHTCDVVGDRMWLVGGKCGGEEEGNFHGESPIFSLDLEEKRWREESRFGEFPRIHSHSSCVDGGKLVVSGGIFCDVTIENEFAVWEVDTEDKTFEKHVISGMEARYSHSSHIKKSPEQKLLLVVGGVVLATDPRSDLAIVSMETWTLLGRVALHQRGIPRHFLGHTSHVVATEGNFSEVVVLGGGSNCFSFGTSFTTSPLVVRVDVGMFL